MLRIVAPEVQKRLEEKPIRLLSKLWHDIAKLKRLLTLKERASPGWDELSRRLLPRIYEQTIEWANAGYHDLEAKPFASVDENSSLEETAIAYLYDYQKKCYQKMKFDKGFVRRQIDIILEESSNPEFDARKITVTINHLELLDKAELLKAAFPKGDYNKLSIDGFCNFGLELKLAQYLNVGPMRMGISREPHAESKLEDSIVLAYTGWNPTLPVVAALILSSKESSRQHPDYYSQSELVEMFLPEVHELDAFLCSISAEQYDEFSLPLGQPEEKITGGADIKIECFRRIYEAFREKAYSVLSDAKGRREFEKKIGPLSRENLYSLSVEQQLTLVRGFATIAVAVEEEYLKEGRAEQELPILQLLIILINKHIVSQAYTYPLTKYVTSSILNKEVRRALLLRRDDKNDMILSCAAYSKNTAAVSALLEAADNDTKREMLLAENTRSKTMPLFLAASKGDSATASALLEAADDDTRHEMLLATDKDGDTVLHLAVIFGNTAAVSALLEVADNNTKNEMLLVTDKDNNTALHLAAIYEDTATVSALLKAHFNNGLPVNYWDYYFGSIYALSKALNAIFEKYFLEEKLSVCDKFAMIHRSRRGTLFFSLPAAVVGAAGALTIQAVAMKSIVLALTLPVFIYGALVGIAGLLLLSFLAGRLGCCAGRTEMVRPAPAQ